MTARGTRARAPAYGPPAGELWPGDVVGERYAIEHEVGRGGMGVVYLAKDLSAKRLCALKEICAELADRADVAERFQTEAKVLSQLSHPCIVSLYATGTHKGRPFIVMEWIDGRTLRDVMHARRKPFTLEEALDIAIQIGSALMVAHRRGVIHRDLKPENVMLRKNAPLKVLDWGLAKLRDGAATTDRLQALATPLYAAPEQLKRGGIDGRTDVYALALMFVEMATGRYAFVDAGETMPSNRIAEELHQQALPNRLIDCVPSCPESLSALIDRALAKDRKDRPDAAVFVEALVREARALGALPEEEEEEAPADDGPRRDTRELPASFRPGDPLARFQRATTTGPRGTVKMETAAALLARQGKTVDQAQAEAAGEACARPASLPPASGESGPRGTVKMDTAAALLAREGKTVDQAQAEARARPASLPPPPVSGVCLAGAIGGAAAPVATTPLPAAPVRGAAPEIPRPSIEIARSVYAAARVEVSRPIERVPAAPVPVRGTTRTILVLTAALVGLLALLAISLWATERWVRVAPPTPSDAASAAPSAASSTTRSPIHVR